MSGFNQFKTTITEDSAEKQDIMEGLRRGHTAVASSLKRGAIELRSGEYVAGDEAPFTGDNVVTVRVPYMKRGEKLRITDGEGVRERASHFLYLI